MAQIERDQTGKSTEPKAAVRSSVFKYYIHDSVESCRLQLLGEFSEADVPELSGCWRTAKTTLGSRKLLLDLRKLRAMDDSGRQWIISMANEGALLIPETALRNGLAFDASAGENVKAGLRTRLLALFRGSRVLSSTQAP